MKIFNNAGSLIVTIAASLWIIDKIWVEIKGRKTRQNWNQYYDEQSQDYRDNRYQ